MIKIDKVWRCMKKKTLEHLPGQNKCLATNWAHELRPNALLHFSFSNCIADSVNDFGKQAHHQRVRFSRMLGFLNGFQLRPQKLLRFDQFLRFFTRACYPLCNCKPLVCHVVLLLHLTITSRPNGKIATARHPNKQANHETNAWHPHTHREKQSSRQTVIWAAVADTHDEKMKMDFSMPDVEERASHGGALAVVVWRVQDNYYIYIYVCLLTILFFFWWKHVYSTTR